MDKNVDFKELERFASRIRVETLKEFREFGSGHVGGAMSTIETLAVFMVCYEHRPQESEMAGQRLSGYLKRTQARRLCNTGTKGIFPYGTAMTLNKPGTDLPSHCDMNHTPGVDMTTGSRTGYQYRHRSCSRNRLDNHNNKYTSSLEDGECDEGQIWEGAMFASHWKIDNQSVSLITISSNLTVIPRMFLTSEISERSLKRSVGIHSQLTVTM